jgi:hypothetical protein
MTRAALVRTLARLYDELRRGLTRPRVTFVLRAAFHGIHADALACALRQLEVDGHAKCGAARPVRALLLVASTLLRAVVSCMYRHTRLFKGATADDQGVKFFSK